MVQTERAYYLTTATIERLRRILKEAYHVVDIQWYSTCTVLHYKGLDVLRSTGTALHRIATRIRTDQENALCSAPPSTHAVRAIRVAVPQSRLARLTNLEDLHELSIVS